MELRNDWLDSGCAARTTSFVRPTRSALRLMERASPSPPSVSRVAGLLPDLSSLSTPLLTAEQCKPFLLSIVVLITVTLAAIVRQLVRSHRRKTK